LVNRLFLSGKIPAFLVEDMFDAARNMFDSELFSTKRFGGATYMTYTDAIRSKKLRSGRKEICVHNIDEERL
jgi:hypothetical protein